MAPAFISFWVIFSPFSHFYSSPCSFNPLICRFTEENAWKRSNLFIFNYHSMLYSIVLGHYYSFPGSFSTGNPLFACKTPHRVPEDEFEDIWWQLLYPSHTFSPRSTANFFTGFLWTWEVNVAYLNLGTFLTQINFVRFDWWMVETEMDLSWIDSAFSQHEEWGFGGIIISTMEMGSSHCAPHVPFIVIRELIYFIHLQGFPVNEPSSVATVEEKKCYFLEVFWLNVVIKPIFWHRKGQKLRCDCLKDNN